MFRRPLRFAVPIVALLAALGLTAANAYAATWSSTAPYASWSNGGYTLYNDVWGSGPGPQTIWANSYSNWGVNSDQPSTGGVKSYPDASRSIGKSVGSLGSCTSSFNETNPSGGAFESAYDIWANGTSDEIMLWTYTQNVGPLGSEKTTASIGGSTWAVYSGSNGSNPVYSFVRTGNESSGSVDIKAVMNWLSSEGWLTGATLSTVDYGWEITSTNGTTENFTINSYSVSC